MPDQRRPCVTTRLTASTHERLTGATREGETLSGTANRALDALAREQALPAPVRETLRERGECNNNDATGDAVNVKFVVPTHERLTAHNSDGEYLSATLARALDALARVEHLPAVVAAVCDD